MSILASLRGAPRFVARSRDDGEQRLAVNTGSPRSANSGSSLEDRRDVVVAGNVGGGQHRDDAGRGAHRVEIERAQLARRLVGPADRDMQRPCGFADVVDIGRRGRCTCRRAESCGSGLWTTGVSRSSGDLRDRGRSFRGIRGLRCGVGAAAAGDFDQRLERDWRRRRAIGGGRAHVGQRLKVRADRRDGRAPARGSSRSAPTSAASAPLRALRRRRHAAIGDARRGDAAAVEVEAEAAHDRGNVLVEALATP